MTHLRHLGVAAAIAAAALAVPAAAAAHPTVYPTIAKRYVGTPPTGTLEEFTRYVVINHGNTIVLTESNNLTTNGVIGFNLVPSGAYRNSLKTGEIVAAGSTGAQAHATCMGGDADLGSLAKVAAWQGGIDDEPPTATQPFWNYVPFQTTSAGLDDNPTAWAPILTAAGFNLNDLATPAGAQTACQAKGGTYRAADTIASTAASLATGLTTPLQAQITTLTEDNAELTEANTTLTAEKAALTEANGTLQAEVDRLSTENATLQTTVFQTSPLTSQVTALTQSLSAANTQIASLTAKLQPIKVTLSDVTASGAKVAVTGQPSSPISVQLLVTEAQARKLKLKSTVLAKKSATTAADGTANLTFKLNKATQRALKSFTGSFTAEAVSGDRFATAKGKVAS